MLEKIEGWYDEIENGLRAMLRELSSQNKWDDVDDVIAAFAVLKEFGSKLGAIFPECEDTDLELPIGSSNVRAVSQEKAEEILAVAMSEYGPCSGDPVGCYVGETPLMARINAICDAPSQTEISAMANTPVMASVLREFMCDIEAAGLEQVQEDWPDLLITYEMAKVALRTTPQPV